MEDMARDNGFCPPKVFLAFVVARLPLILSGGVGESSKARYLVVFGWVPDGELSALMGDMDSPLKSSRSLVPQPNISNRQTLHQRAQSQAAPSSGDGARRHFCQRSSWSGSSGPEDHTLTLNRLHSACANCIRAEAPYGCLLPTRSDVDNYLGPVGYDVASDIGRRLRLEDAYSIVLDLMKADEVLRRHSEGSTPGCQSDRLQMFAVFDGHGGLAAADFARKHFHAILADELARRPSVLEAMHFAMLETDRLFSLTHSPSPSTSSTGSHPPSYSLPDAETARLTATMGLEHPSCAKVGTTVTCILAEPLTGKVWTTHVGDSEAWLFARGRAVRLVRPHKPLRSDERRRVEAAGGIVSKQYVRASGRRIGRVNGVLSVSRAIGDRHLKQWVIATPEVSEFQLKGDEEFLVIASDGLWDVLAPQLVYKTVADHLVSKFEAADDASVLRITPQILRLCKGCARLLTFAAISNSSTDNVTCIVIFFRGVINLFRSWPTLGSSSRRTIKPKSRLRLKVKQAIRRLFSSEGTSTR